MIEYESGKCASIGVITVYGQMVLQSSVSEECTCVCKLRIITVIIIIQVTVSKTQKNFLGV